MIRRPDYIKTGDTIGVTAPSYGAVIEPYNLRYPIAKEKITQRGYKVIDGETVFKGDGIGISTDPKVTAKELTEFYERDDIDAIISAGGGELMNETINNIDFDYLKNLRPKWFMGYSDNTNFIFPMVTIAEVQGIYGPCFGGFAKEWESTEKDAFALLEGKKSSFDGYDEYVDPTLVNDDDHAIKNYTDEELRAPLKLNSKRILKRYISESGKFFSIDDSIEMEGILLGGCLDVLLNLVGTRFDRVREFKQKYGDIIWIFEACDLSPMSIRRGLWSLREAGWLDGAKGFIIGRPMCAWKQDMLGVNQYNAVTDILGEINAPVIMDAEVGHIEPMLPVIMGAQARVKAADNLNISYM